MVKKINAIATNLAQINNDTSTIQLVIEQIAAISEESASGMRKLQLLHSKLAVLWNKLITMLKP